MDLKERTALVTGGAVRLGEAICLALAARGCRVAVHYRRSRESAERVVETIAGRGGTAWAVHSDLASEAGCRGLLPAAERVAGSPVDLLVNNAGVFYREPPGHWSGEKFDAMFWPNLFAPMLLTRDFADRASKGAVVNLLDRRVAGHDPSCIPYQVSKTALAEFTASAAIRWAPEVTINAVAPGPILPPPGEGEAYLAAHRGSVPLAHGGAPRDVAEAVVYLVTAEAVTGQILYVDGGKHLLGVEHG